MNASALVPPLIVEVEAVSSPEAMAEAKTIRLNPDSAITITQQKQPWESCSCRPDRHILSWLLPWRSVGFKCQNGDAAHGEAHSSKPVRKAVHHDSEVSPWLVPAVTAAM